MSQFFLVKYRLVVDALLKVHKMSVPDATRDMLADTIAHSRELPASEPKPPGSRSALSALRTARTHAKKLIEYVDHPPARKASVPLRCAKLAAAILSNELRAGLDLALAGIDPNALLDALDSASIDVETLRRMVEVVDAVESGLDGIGRPWAAHTRIIRTGCIAWRRAGRANDAHWIVDDDRLTGGLPDFLRELIACCDGTHAMVREPPRRVPIGYRDSRPAPRGDALRGRVSDLNIRDGIRAWERWLRGARRKNPILSL